MKKTILIPAIALLLIIIGVVIQKQKTTSLPSQSEVKNVDMLQNDQDTEMLAQEVAYHETVKGWYAQPKEAGEYPGIVMIHEWWGLNDNIKETAEELAQSGYRVLAVDLYEGVVATTSEHARALSSSIDKEEALTNMKAATAYLRARGASKIASLGWCFGGARSLELSLSDEDLDATVIYYGQLITDTDQLAGIDQPVLGIFGEEDTSIPVATVQEFDAALDSLVVQNVMLMYPFVGLSFANPSGIFYAIVATEDAWNKTLQFLATNLK